VILESAASVHPSLRTADHPRDSESSRAVTESTRQGRAASERLQGASRIFRKLQDWSTESTRREVVETTRTVGSTEGLLTEPLGGHFYISLVERTHSTDLAARIS